MKTATKLRIASILYRALKSIRRLAGATDLAQVRRNGLHWELDLCEGIDLAIFAFGSFEHETARALKKLVSGSTYSRRLLQQFQSLRDQLRKIRCRRL
jgi:hypothetical protein